MGAAEVRELVGTRTIGNYDRAMLVTSSKFTRAAYELGARANIDLVDRDTLSKWAQSLQEKTK